MWSMVLYISIGSASICQAQDKVSNGSFEDSWGPVVEWAQIRYATNWHSNGALYDPTSQDVWGHSPDYFDDQTPFAPVFDPSVGMRSGVAPAGVTAHTGHKFIGMDDYELIQQQFGHNALQERRFYTVSMFIRPSNYYFNGTSNLRIRLGSNEFHYQNSTDATEVCSSDYMNYNDPVHVQELASIPINLNDYPADRWTRISTTFYVSEELNQTFEWLMVDMNSGGNAQVCGQHYIFVDDVSFVRSEYCHTACAPELNSPSTGAIPNAMVANGFCAGPGYCDHCSNLYLDLCTPDCDPFGAAADYCYCCPVQFFQMIFTDALAVNFRVHDRWNWGDIIYESHNFDANGLKFADQPYFVLQWMGKDKNGNYLPNPDVYPIEIEWWNCDNIENPSTYNGYITYLGVGYDNYSQPPERLNGAIANCCLDHLYFQNQTFSGFEQKDATTFITAGSNVTNGTPGPVIVPYTSYVIFHAGEEINLEPGFAVSPGGRFEAVISDCVYGETKNAPQAPEFMIVDMASTGRPVEHTVTLYPNPTNGPFTVMLPEGMERGNITVMDPTGKVVRTFQANSRISDFDMMGLSRGIYFLEVFSGGSFLQSFRLTYE